MELREYLGIARRWLWLFALATAVAAAGAWVATSFIPRSYMAQTTLMVGRPTDNPDPNSSSLYVSMQLAGTYATMVTREPVLQGVVRTLKLQTDWQTLQGMVKAAPEPSSPLLEIRVIDVDPERARIIADEVANQLIDLSPTPTESKKRKNQQFVEDQITVLQANIEKALSDLRDVDSKIVLETSARAIADLQSRKAALQSQMQTWSTQLGNYLNFSRGSEVNSLAVIEPATRGVPVGPNTLLNVLLAALLGFGLALGAVMLLEYLDDTVKTAENLVKRVGVTGLATIGLVGDVVQRRDVLVSVLQPRSPAAEAFRVLRTNLQFSLLRKPKAVLVVTSANPGEGKSTVSVNLAVVIAQGGKRVILVDSDLRRPSIHHFFNLPNQLGMTSLLLDEDLRPDDVLHSVGGVPGLEVITSGPLLPNPAEVIGSPEMAALVERLRQRSDVVVLDSPPLLVVADAAILAGDADGTLLVFDSGVTRIDAAKRALETLQRVEVTPVGAVINKLDPARMGGYGYHYYRYNDYYSSDNSSSDGDHEAGAGTDAPPQRVARAPWSHEDGRDGRDGRRLLPANGGLRERLRNAVASFLS